jgi:hypothetical protein
VFDLPTGEVSFGKLGRKTVLQAVKGIFADQPARPKPIVDQAAPVPLKAVAATAAQPPGAGSIETAAASLIEAGVKLMESIFHDGASGSSGGAPGSRLEQILSGLCTRDARTNRPVLSIPLPESVSQERIARAISGLVNSLGRVAAGAGKT